MASYLRITDEFGVVGSYHGILKEEFALWVY
jgi:hypothetical protein